MSRMMETMLESLITALILTMVTNAGVLVAFYYNTKYQLKRHDKDISSIMEELKRKADTESLDDLKCDINRKFDAIDKTLNNIYNHLINNKKF